MVVDSKNQAHVRADADVEITAVVAYVGIEVQQHIGALAEVGEPGPEQAVYFRLFLALFHCIRLFRSGLIGVELQAVVVDLTLAVVGNHCDFCGHHDPLNVIPRVSGSDNNTVAAPSVLRNRYQVNL